MALARTILSRALSTAAPAAPHVAARRVPGIPMLPLVGSLPWRSSIVPGVDWVEHEYESRPALLAKYGPLYRVGLPGLGKGLTGELYVCSDPVEHMKVLRLEGQFPMGIVQLLWPSAFFFTKHKYRAVGKFFTQADGDWKRLRAAMQKDLLPPAAAQAYLPAISDAARAASEAMASHAGDLAEFTSRASFDMFAALHLGRKTRTANPGPDTAPEDRRFCKDTLVALHLLGPLIRSPMDLMLASVGIESSMLRTFNKNMEFPFRRAHALTEELIARLDRDGPEALTEAERRCYAVRAYQRLVDEGASASVTKDELLEVVNMTLVAAVDTTSSLINWALVHLARNASVQEKLHAELAAELRGGPLTEEVVSSGRREWLPYLNAVVRESHRLTPSTGMSVVKHVDRDIELCGYTVPAGSIVGLDLVSSQMHPDIVEDAHSFRPERFLPDAITARQGTPGEVLDHRLISTPFSAGARMCPGSRTAALEVRALLAQVVQDWKFSLAPGTPERIPYKLGTTINPEPMPAFVVEPRT